MTTLPPSHRQQTSLCVRHKIRARAAVERARVYRIMMGEYTRRSVKRGMQPIG